MVGLRGKRHSVEDERRALVAFSIFTGTGLGRRNNREPPSLRAALACRRRYYCRMSS